MQSTSIKRTITNPDNIYRIKSDIFRKISPPIIPQTAKQKRVERVYEIYQTLKEQQNTNQIVKKKVRPFCKTTLTRTVNLTEINRQKSEQQFKDQAFQHRKKQLLEKTSAMLKHDLKNLKQISATAYDEFNYNYITKELGAHEVNYEDLNVSHNNLCDKDRYTYRHLLNYTVPKVNMNNEEAITQKKEMQNYLYTPEQLKSRQLKEVQLPIITQNEEEQQFFMAVKDNDLSQVRLLISINPQLVHSLDYLGQTALHWACKRNYIEMSLQLMSNGIDQSVVDTAGRNASMIAHKFKFYKLAKLVQVDDDIQHI